MTRPTLGPRPERMTRIFSFDVPTVAYVEWLEQALREACGYAAHHETCDYIQDELPCSCGLSDLLASLPGELK
jgi:hypothetical protein